MITIAELRARNNKMSQQKLADEIGVGVDSVRRWERDIYTISANNLKKLATYFNVSADDLLGT
ncbi:MAG TPA: helix-turn-helix transcriptional regulator, partial [Candidatus Sphingobacterium stercoripullorum]|nr:helix-turn-helix transcriptional regulator [Candidatus Sphingobacterium stercoripullorum]